MQISDSSGVDQPETPSTPATPEGDPSDPGRMLPFPPRWEPPNRPVRRVQRQLLREAEWCAAGINGGGPATAFNHMSTRSGTFLDGLQELIGSGDADGAHRLGLAMGRYWWTRDYATGWDALEDILALPVAENLEAANARLRGWRGRLGLRLGKSQVAERDFRHALTVAHRLRDQRLEAESLNDLSVWAF